MSNSKGYDKVTFIGVGACVIALVLIFIYGPKPQPAPRAREQQPNQTAQQSEAPAAPQQQAAAGNGSEAAATTAPATGAFCQDVSAPHLPSAFDCVEIPLEGNAVIKLDPAGAGIQSIQLNDYQEESAKTAKGEPCPVSLGTYDYPFLALTAPGTNFLLGEPVSKNYDQANRAYTISRRTLDEKVLVTECWKASAAKSYEITYTVNFKNLSQDNILVQGFRVEGGAMPESVTPNRKAGRGESSGGASIGRGKDSKDFPLKKLAKLDDDDYRELATTSANWVAVHSKYFLLASWLENATYAGVEAASVPSAFRKDAKTEPDKRFHLRGILPSQNLIPNGSLEYSVTAYAGPKMFERLYSYRNGLDTVMEMDRFFFWRPSFMRAISRGLLWLLVVISKCFPPELGYGLAIIILTIIVKAIFIPLSYKSTVSMRKMQALKPELDALRAKFKDDPQTLYRKQQELYKKNNVSQLGGCLPMLLQIPVFFALFNTFRNAIEMRHACFLWAYDLSMPDTLMFSADWMLPIRPLALLMGLTMFFQQKLTPSPDPSQAKMMNFMTIFFTFLFYSMPSALTLYLSVSYILGIAQTMLINKYAPKN